MTVAAHGAEKASQAGPMTVGQRPAMWCETCWEDGRAVACCLGVLHIDSGRVEGWAAVVVLGSSRADSSHCWDQIVDTSLDAGIAEVACSAGIHSPYWGCHPCAVAAY